MIHLTFEELLQLVETYAMAVESKLQEVYNFLSPADRPIVEIEKGRKYFKLVCNYGHQRMVHAFVDQTTGDVFKPASWTKPEKGARFNLLMGMTELLNVIDPYGSYLYYR